jgi:hypothetical protein
MGRLTLFQTLKAGLARVYEFFYLKIFKTIGNVPKTPFRDGGVSNPLKG